MRHALLALLVLLSGCLDRIILDGTIASTRTAASAFDTLSDLEVAKTGAAASLVNLEGMQTLAPDNEDALFLLLQGWTGYAGAFIEDGWEEAFDRGDDDAEAAQSERAKQAYDRALRFGSLLMEQKHPGFAAAQRNAETMGTYLAQFKKDDAELLLWMGGAWLSRASVAAERPELVAELFVGVSLAERSVALDDTLAYGLGYAMLGAYHARSPDAELAQAKALFEKSIAQTQRKALSTQVLYAQNYACNAHDAALYRALLDEVRVAPVDLLPAQRLENEVAHRKANRYLRKVRLQRCGF